MAHDNPILQKIKKETTATAPVTATPVTASDKVPAPAPAAGSSAKLQAVHEALDASSIRISTSISELEAGAKQTQLATDVITFSMQEFGFISLPEAFCSGSSIMPQKKNPDVLELIRAKYHVVLADEFKIKSIISNKPR